MKDSGMGSSKNSRHNNIAELEEEGGAAAPNKTKLGKKQKFHKRVKSKH